MDFELISLRLRSAATRKIQALAVLVPEDFEPGDDALSRLIAEASDAGDFKAKAGQSLSAWGAEGVKARRILLVGAGDGSPADLRKAAAAAVGAFKAGPTTQLTLCMAGGSGGVGAVVLAAAEAAYTYRTTISKDAKKDAPELRKIVIGVPGSAAARAAFDEAVGVAQGVAFAREWANRPPNHATPSHLGRAAQGLSKRAGFSCKVLGPKETDKLGMGALRAVAQGSRQPSRFIELSYKGGPARQAPVVLVGKGITFDSGGISIKPPAAMDEMKFDMGGAASVLGVFRALAELKPRINVVGLIASCENLPGGAAVKPGDVITGMSGQTIEVLNTDAEGRLVLSDALTYAERFKPRALIDIATLTGACVIALGAVRSGMFSSSDALAQALLTAGEQAQDLCWRMPLDEEYASGLKSNFADVANVAGRPAGVVTAAKFLQRFVGEYDWAHLDIAGTAWQGGKAKGATGRPVGLLLRYLLNVAAEDAKAAPARAGRKKPAKSVG